MTCPHCNHVFPLTWRLYFQTPLPSGRHTCPACGRESRFRNEATPQVLALLAGVAGMLPYLWLLRDVTWDRARPRDWAIFAAAACTGLFLGLITDNYVKSRVRKLEKCAEPK